MPQLNPAPWFVTLLFSWFILLTIIPPKIMAHTFPHEPNLQDFKKSMTESWSWPWY